jgi:hypothetical protein
LKWPLAEGLAAYEFKLREDEQRKYDVAYISWAIIAQASRKPPKQPKFPDILKDA